MFSQFFETTQTFYHLQALDGETDQAASRAIRRVDEGRTGKRRAAVQHFQCSVANSRNFTSNLFIVDKHKKKPSSILPIESWKPQRLMRVRRRTSISSNNSGESDSVTLAKS